MSAQDHANRQAPEARVGLAAVLSDRLLRNLGWYAAGEFVQRATRIATTVILALYLSPAEFGVAAIAITAFELIRVLNNNGIGQAVVRADADRLEGTAVTAWRLGWLVCASMAAIQVAAGAGLAWHSGRADIFAMVACLAGVYLAMPFGLVPSYLVQRSNRLGAMAAVQTTQNVVDNVLTVALALAGWGAWAIVLPKLLTAPIWVLGMRRAHPWRRAAGVQAAPVGELTAFAAPVLGAEILTALRLNIDKVLVGAILGVEALGIYYFVFNAGIGLSLSLTTALTASIYPHLVQLRDRPPAMLARFDRSLVRIALPIGAVIGLQAVAALWYVPFIFGAKWQAAAPLVAMLCASAITKPLFDATAQLLRAAGRPGLDLAGSLALTGLTLGVFAGLLPYGLFAAIAGFAATASVLQIGLAAAGRRWIGPERIVGRAADAASPAPATA